MLAETDPRYDDDWSNGPTPDRDEIEAMEDYRVLWEMLDDYESAIIRVETSLKFPADLDRDWFLSARGALIRFRIAKNQIEKRLKVLGKNRMGPSVAAVAPAE